MYIAIEIAQQLSHKPACTHTSQGAVSFPQELLSLRLALHLESGGWRDGAVVKSTELSPRGPGFDLQHSYLVARDHQ